MTGFLLDQAGPSPYPGGSPASYEEDFSRSGRPVHQTAPDTVKPHVDASWEPGSEFSFTHVDLDGACVWVSAFNLRSCYEMISEGTSQ